MAPRRGNQQPTFEHVGEYDHSYGADAVETFNSMGVDFYPCQEHEMEVFLARDGHDRFASKSIGLSKPRQNGKSYSARWYAIWMAAVEGKAVLYTAHHGRTVRKMFKFVADAFTGKAELDEQLKPCGSGIYRTWGSEGIYCTNGGCIEFQTRTASAGLGGTYDVIIVDEAQLLTDDQYDTLKPTTLASESGDPQMIFIGTPPRPTAPVGAFRRMHDSAHDGATSTWWMEWAVDDMPRTTDHDELMELVYLTNPAMGYRIHDDVMTDAMPPNMADDSFARECLGWWSDDTIQVEHVIPAAAWDACRIAAANAPKGGITTFAVKFSPDGAVGTVAACVKPDGGTPYVEVVENRSMASGMAWFVDFIESHKDNAAQVVVDGSGNAQTLCDMLNLNRHQLIKPTAQQMAGACSMMLNAVNDGAVSHMGQKALDASATMTAKRAIGRGWGFDSTEDADATLIESCALALWSANTTKRDPTRRMRVL